MIYKAKRIDDGDWVAGYYWEIKDTWYIRQIQRLHIFDFKIDPSTVCEKVKGTEFFDGDEVSSERGTGYIEWNDTTLCWSVNYGAGERRTLWSILELEVVNKTGRNRHD
jgi:ethanolamine utilization protein EutQ (cupin superfamily)